MDTTLDSIRELRFYQSKDGYRFSMDPVLLSDFISMRSARRILDLGAGSGVLGLMLAARYPKSHLTMVELQAGLHALCGRNITLNAMAARAEAIKADLAALPSEYAGAFDLVVSNPPFRRPATGLLSEGEERMVARHELRMDLNGLVASAARALKERGRFALVYHPARLAELLSAMAAASLEPKCIRFVHGRLDSEARIVLVEAVKGGRQGGLKVLPPLVVYGDGGGYSDEVRRIYKLDDQGIV